MLLIDSSFPPIKKESFDFVKPDCFIISESGGLKEEKGECFNEEGWKQLESFDPLILKGMMNSLAGMDAAESSKWIEFNSLKPNEAKEMRNNYILAAHGSRAAFIAYQYSNTQAHILPLRVVTSSAGPTKQKQDVAMIKGAKLSSYSNGCGLSNWSKDQLERFRTKKELQAYQKKMASILKKNPSIRMISISLGYKKSWIKEDNPQCSDEQVEKEYRVLMDSWRNLFAKFRDRIFIVAAGNEGLDLDAPLNKADDLWATLGIERNLLMVGSLKKNGERLSSSNYGKNVLMALGEEIKVASPMPHELSGYETTVRGTSFSAPIVSGIAIKFLGEKPKMSLKEWRGKITKAFSEKSPPAFFSCKILKDCIQPLLDEDLLWGRFSSHYKKGVSLWGWKPKINVLELNKEGQQQLEPTEKGLIPTITLAAEDDPFEMVITLNHELVHFVNAHQSLPLISDNNKTNGCLTPYRLSLLKDETRAFLEEIYFWEESPDWFKLHFNGKSFDSRLLAQKVGYGKYYQTLKEKMQKDPLFVEKRYIEMGEYPECAKKLLE